MESPLLLLLIGINKFTSDIDHSLFEVIVLFLYF